MAARKPKRAKRAAYRPAVGDRVAVSWPEHPFGWAFGTVMSTWQWGPRSAVVTVTVAVDDDPSAATHPTRTFRPEEVRPEADVKAQMAVDALAGKACICGRSLTAPLICPVHGIRR